MILMIILKKYNIPTDIFKYKEFSKEFIKKNLDVSTILKAGKIKDYFSNDEIKKLNLSVEDKIKYNLSSFITDGEINKLDIVEKLKLYNDYKLEILRKHITDDELYSLNTIFKITHMSINGINLFDYITKEEMDNLSLETKVEHRLHLTDDELKKLTWKQKYYWNENHFTDDDLKEISKLSFKEKLEIKNKNVFDDKYNKELILNDKYKDYIYLDILYNGTIKIKYNDDYLSNIDDDNLLLFLNIIDNDLYRYDDLIKYITDVSYAEYSDEFDNYTFNEIGDLLDDELLNKIKKLFNYFKIDDSNIIEYSVIKDFLIKYNELLSPDIKNIISKINLLNISNFENEAFKISENILY